MPAPAVVEGLHLPVIGERAAGPADAPLAAEDRGSDGPVGKVTAGRTSDVSGKGTESSKPFFLSKDMAPVPAKLVAKIHRSEFVDMAELLRDNLEVRRQEDNHEIPTSGESKRSRREIPDLISWVQCFGTYMAVVALKHPEKVRQMLAYQTMIVRESRRCGGRGWLSYDTMFRQQAAGDPQLDWSNLNTTLFATTFLAQAESRKNCGLCLEADHLERDCALAKPSAVPSMPRSGHSRDSSRGGTEPSRWQGEGTERVFHLEPG